MKRIRTYSSDEALVAERRRQIALSAMKPFLRRGYKGTIRELSKATGMAPGAIYHYIGSKKDILHLICSYLAHPGRDLEAFVCGLGDVGMTETLRQSIKSYFHGCDDARERNIFFNREIGNFSPEDRRMLLASQVEIVEFFEKLIIKGIEAGEFETDSPLLVAHWQPYLKGHHGELSMGLASGMGETEMFKFFWIDQALRSQFAGGK